ncbi:uncharacterized protein FIESC28_01867 [Fusarium coffeatum]|uniref:C2H2-type domain-containing protein n=1 Tax=Fusarium coffeatum TaxID=231269 RepID=A0A366S9N4_9HYPO|nr:uncharacterized protein FIESC28_01867 [Fusarium coffeatum]RBR25430.1 hypothetical protein FIESC28_01867 [Fusarium coffeatum]
MEPARKRIKLEEEPNPQRLPSPELSFKDQAATEPHCDGCVRIFRSKAELQRHNSKYHYNEFLCKACDEGFETRNQLNQHVMDAVRQYCGTVPQDSMLNLNYKCPGCSKKHARMHALFHHLEDRGCNLRNWLEETRVQDLLIALERPIERAKETLFSCTGCAKVFNNPHSLEQHLRSVHKGTYCFSCAAHFPNAERRMRHFIDSTGYTPGEFRCGDCQSNEVFHVERDFNVHARVVHRKCAPCGQAFKTQGSLIDHEHEAHNKCLECLQCFYTRDALTSHMQSATEGCALANRSSVSTDGPVVRPVTPEAEAVTEAREILREAITRMSSVLVKAEPRVATTLRMEDIPDATSLECRYCYFSCSSEAALASHCDGEHRDEITTWCEPCQEQYESYEDYYQHLVNTPQHFPCTACCEIELARKDWVEAVFEDHGSQEALDAHIKESEHAFCAPCSKWFMHKTLLQSHEEEVHEPAWPFICKPCDRAFPEWRDRDKHQLTHSDTPTRCLGCRKSFGCYSLMFEHLESGKCNSGANRDKLKMYISNIYGRQTDNEHMHLNYKCPQCPKKFHLMSWLFKHLEVRACPLRKWKDYTQADDLLFKPLKHALRADVLCTKCDRAFKTPERQRDHIWEKHEATFCFMCNEHFPSKEALSDHISEFEAGNEYGIKELSCQMCTSAKWFETEREFYAHSWKEHFCCEVCQQIFDTEDELVEHDEQDHFMDYD